MNALVQKTGSRLRLAWNLETRVVALLLPLVLIILIAPFDAEASPEASPGSTASPEKDNPALNTSPLDFRTIFPEMENVEGGTKAVSSYGIFTIQGNRIGDARISVLEAGRIKLQFYMDYTGSGVSSGSFTIVFHRRSSRGALYRIRYQDDGGNEIEESVEIELYLLRKGIITFSFGEKQQLFHLSRNSTGEVLLVAGQGRVLLRPTPP